MPSLINSQCFEIFVLIMGLSCHLLWSIILSVCSICDKDYQSWRILHVMAIYLEIRVLGFWGPYLGVCVKFVDDFKAIWLLKGLIIWILFDPSILIDEKIVLEVYDCKLYRLIIHLSCMTSKDHKLVIPYLLELIIFLQWT